MRQTLDQAKSSLSLWKLFGIGSLCVNSRGLFENQSLEPLIVVLTSGSEPELEEVCRREWPPDP